MSICGTQESGFQPELPGLLQPSLSPQALPIPLLGIFPTPRWEKSGEMSSVWLLEDFLDIDEYIRGLGTGTVCSAISAGLEDE